MIKLEVDNKTTTNLLLNARYMYYIISKFGIQGARKSEQCRQRFSQHVICRVELHKHSAGKGHNDCRGDMDWPLLQDQVPDRAALGFYPGWICLPRTS